MQSISLVNIIIFFSCIAISAFFSAAETAYTAVNKAKLKHALKDKDKKWALLQHIYTDPKKLITSILIGNNISNVAASAIATSTLLAFLTTFQISGSVAIAIITFIVTTIILIFGEITPKVIALKNPETVSILFSKPIQVVLIFFSPIIFTLDFVTSGFKKILNIEASVSEKNVVLEEMRMILDMGREEGLVEDEKSEMLENIFELSDTVVREIMTPRTDTTCININKSIDEAIALFTEKGFSRIPVYEERVDNVLGILYAKDLLEHHLKGKTDTIKDMLRSAVFIPESKPTETALQQMKRAKIHMAIVVDEYGGMSGIVTLEDIIEEIIGEIQDEYDSGDESYIKKLNNNHFLVDAKIAMKDLSDTIKCEFPETDEYDTLGGFVLSQLGKFPTKEEHLHYEDIRFIVKEIKKRRIISLEIKLPDTEKSLKEKTKKSNAA